ncbi:MAG: hypothetical protein E6J90_26345 [Deltaproteobacteria bacterium]|nr:MAG: hypothetical protein E6J90_26345 [Deltaproteobacteria bacterium]
MTDASALRTAILTSVPADPFQTTAPEPRFVYVPRTHVRALDPDNMLVVGARGTGKSFWWQALLSDAARATLQIPSMSRGKLQVGAGWSENTEPDKDTLAGLRRAGADPRQIWRAVLLAQFDSGVDSMDSWKDRVDWVANHPEAVAKLIRSYDDAADADDTRHLLLFDALDRTADEWTERRALLKGLLQLVLDLRSTKAIRAKVFVRPDMIQDPEVLAFVDSSKVVGSRIELTWPRHELYGLLWQYMGNAFQGAATFRRRHSGWKKDETGLFRMPDTLRTNEQVQRDVFAEIAGKAMGTNERRGLPFTWIPTHLADASSIVTPRSFLAALRTAADETNHDSELALDWRSIHSGVRRASEIRVIELGEDFPWTKPAMAALEGLNVPCSRKDLVSRWTANSVMERLDGLPTGDRNKNATLGQQGLLNDLVEVGVLEVRSDGRYNIPDVYRVGFGLKRRGGVRPVT